MGRLTRSLVYRCRLWTGWARALLRRQQYPLREFCQDCREGFAAVFLRGKTRPAGEGMESIDLAAIRYRVLVSLEQHRGRRANAQRQLAGLGIDAEWKIPVKIEDIPWARIPRQYAEKPEVASHTMTLLAIFDEVEKAKVPFFMHIEDDVIFHPRMAKLLRRLRVPSDWQFIYLGGRNNGTKWSAAPGLVRSDRISDLHAVIIRSGMIPHMRRLIFDPAIETYHVDFRIAELHPRYPAYLCRPNLAWQSPHHNDAGIGLPYCNYYANGEVKIGQGD